MIKHQLRAAEKNSAEGLSRGEHIHPELELLLVESDEVPCRINYVDYKLSSGTLVLFNNLEHHSLSVKGQGYHRLLLMFRPAYLRGQIAANPQLLGCFFQRPKPEANILRLNQEEAESVRRKMKELIAIRAAQGEPTYLPTAESYHFSQAAKEDDWGIQRDEDGEIQRYVQGASEGNVDSSLQLADTGMSAIMGLDEKQQEIYLQMMLGCLLMEVNGLHQKYYPSDRKVSDDYSLVSCIIQYIQENLGDPERVSLENLSREFALSRTVLCKTFKYCSGTSLRQYIIDCRIWQAQEYLKQGMPVQEVGERLGYSDPAHFSRVFRQKTGLTPREWRMGVSDKI